MKYFIGIIYCLFGLYCFCASAKENQINQEYGELEYTFDHPYMKLNPYDKNILSALIKFPTEQKAIIKTRLLGQDGAEDLIHVFTPFLKEHTIYVAGLYPDSVNEIEITAVDENGQQKNTFVKIKTPRLSTVPLYWVTTKKDKENRYYYSSRGGNYIYDEFGHIRFAFENEGYQTFFKDGKIIEDAWQGHMIREYNLMGKLIRTIRYTPRFNSFNHGLYFMPNGNYLMIGTLDKPAYYLNNKKVFLAYDTIIEIDKNKGQILKKWDLKSILNPSRMCMAGPMIDRENKYDWAHVNSVRYLPEDNSLLISAKHIGMIKIDYHSGALKWVATAHLDCDLKPAAQSNTSQNILHPSFLTAVLDPDSPTEKLPESVQMGLDNTLFQWPIFNHDAKKTKDLYSIFSNNGRPFDKRLKSSDTSSVFLYKIDEKAKTIQMHKKINLDVFADIASNATINADKNDIFIMAADIKNKNTGQIYNKLYRFDLQNNEKLFEAIIYNDQYHYVVEPVSFNHLKN